MGGRVARVQRQRLASRFFETVFGDAFLREGQHRQRPVDRFAAELIASPLRRRSLFGIQLADALGELHATPAGLEAAYATVARVHSASARGDLAFVEMAMASVDRALARYRQTPLASDAAGLLEQLTSVLSARRGHPPARATL